MRAHTDKWCRSYSTWRDIVIFRSATHFRRYQGSSQLYHVYNLHSEPLKCSILVVTKIFQNMFGAVKTLGSDFQGPETLTRLSLNPLPRDGRRSLYVSRILQHKIVVVSTTLGLVGRDLSPYFFITPAAHIGRYSRAKPCTTPYEIRRAPTLCTY
jgi:hypothetical protein